MHLQKRQQFKLTLNGVLLTRMYFIVNLILLWSCKFVVSCRITFELGLDVMKPTANVFIQNLTSTIVVSCPPASDEKHFFGTVFTEQRQHASFAQHSPHVHGVTVLTYPF